MYILGFVVKVGDDRQELALSLNVISLQKTSLITMKTNGYNSVNYYYFQYVLTKSETF